MQLYEWKINMGKRKVNHIYLVPNKSNKLSDQLFVKYELSNFWSPLVACQRTTQLASAWLTSDVDLALKLCRPCHYAAQTLHEFVVCFGCALPDAQIDVCHGWVCSSRVPFHLLPLADPSQGTAVSTSHLL